jgi:anhydro-N-acetylmuramic acid kinase
MPLLIGLMSGTSADGVDAALVRIAAGAQTIRPQLEAFQTVPFPAGMREAILAASEASTGTVERLCRLNVALGEVFAEAAVAVASQARVGLEAIDLIGSHGQTVHHLPQPVCMHGYVVRSTLQLGEPSVIAERTGIMTVADFRPRDLAAGGEGAPLAPYAHHLLFSDPQRERLVHNIGGISNVTLLPAGGTLNDVLAFDTGPGNMPIDGLVSRLSGGRETFDRDGRRARRGRVHQGLIDEWLAHPFLHSPPPKSTGREVFGNVFLEQACAQAGALGLTDDDLVATLTAFTAASIVEAYRAFILPAHPRIESILCGGGSHNQTLTGWLQAALPAVSWRSCDEFGLSADALESVSFALLAYETIRGRATNVPAATGARRAAILGKVVPGRDGWATLHRLQQASEALVP